MDNGASEQTHAVEADEQSERSFVLAIRCACPLNAIEVAQFHLLKVEPSNLVIRVASELT